MGDYHRRDYVYSKVEELRDAIKLDSYNLSTTEQNALERKLDDLKVSIDAAYVGK